MRSSNVVLASLAAVMVVALPLAAQEKPKLYSAPDDSTIAAQPNAAQIIFGKQLLNETERLLPDHVSAGLNCTSCHLNNGTQAYASQFTNLAKVYPTYNARAGRVVSLAERINGCFLRSMNGSPLPTDSKEMQAMLAYMNWLAQDIPRGAKVAGAGLGQVDTSLTPDPKHGAAIYADKCASCHGVKGEGVRDPHGTYISPPLWGDDSFNIGAGMARTMTAAAFVKHNMPPGVGVNPGGALSDQDAVDVAEFFTHQPRPDFPAKVKDWPKGGKPKDSRY
jgi:thiosulfate dehydrogenase